MRIIITLALVSPLLLAACGGSDEPFSDPTAADPPASDAKNATPKSPCAADPRPPSCA